MRTIINGMSAVFLAGLLGVAQTTAANELAYFQTIANTDMVVAGVGGLRNQTSGVITVEGVSFPIRKAYLYWHGPTKSTDPAVNASVFLNGNSVQGTNIGFAYDNTWGFDNSQAYRADVTHLILSNGAYKFTGFRSDPNTTAGGANMNGASLVIFFNDANPDNNRDVMLFDGNDSNVASTFDAAGWNATLAVPLTGSAGAAKIQLHVSDGQTFTDDAVKLNSATLAASGAVFDGNTVPATDPDGPTGNGSLWDIKPFDIPSGLLSEGANTLLLTTGTVQDHLSLVVVAVQVAAGTVDTDGDGVPDSTDNCPLDGNPGQEDGDGDLVGDVCDNCPEKANASQSDSNGDGKGDACQADSTATVTGPTAPVQPGGVMLFSMTVKNTGSSPMRTTKPDCRGNTVFRLVCGNNTADPNIVESIYGNDDLIIIPPGGEASVTCDQKYDGPTLKAFVDANDGACQVVGTYSNYMVDRHINENGQCTLPGGTGCIFDIWQGFVTAPAKPVQFAGDPVTRPGIDVEPFFAPNVWRCDLRDPIPVAVLSREDFDASKVDPTTVTFGKNGNEARDPWRFTISPAKRMKDVNNDGLPDMLFAFPFNQTGFSCKDIPAAQKSVTVHPILKGTAVISGQKIPIADSDVLLLRRPRDD